MSSNGSTYFDSQFQLPDQLISIAREVTSFAGHFVESREPKAFKWTEFKNSVDEYPGDDLTFNKFKSSSIDRQEATVSDMAQKIVDALRLTISPNLTGENIVALYKSLEKTSTSLDVAKTSGWADFSKSSSGSESSWQYRVQFAFPNPDLPSYIYSLVTTIKLEADIKDEASWRGLQSDTKKNFSAEIEAIEFLVMKGFESPQ
ncbi:hypothetical protein PM082_001503 [Marasmius tenuissimus]|nr:hypothetical protein PM082_001503 [Marasmius tenuissimus]